MNHPTNILLVDDNDDPNFYGPLADYASMQMNCNLEITHTWEEAVQTLEANPHKFQALILDGKGQKRKGSKTEDDGFLTPVLQSLRDRTHVAYGIPYVIYTGHTESIPKIFDEEKIFFKGGAGEEEKMFAYLQQTIGQPELVRARTSHPELFALFSKKVLDGKHELEVAKAIAVCEGESPNDADAVMRSLRPIVENSFLNLYALDPSLIKPSHFPAGKPNISGIIWYLAGSPKRDPTTKQWYNDSAPIYPEHIYRALEALQSITSATVMHNYTASTTIHTLRLCASALLDYLTWLSTFIKTHFP